MSVFAKPYDKVMGRRLITYGIVTEMIPKSHFGFLPGTGCEDALLSIVNEIQKLQRRGQTSHVVLLDFKSAFDTVPHAAFLKTLDHGFAIKGHAYRYFECCFAGRRGRVDVGNFKSQWRADPKGLLQGWPPSSIAWIYYVADLEIVERMQLGLRLPCYADDVTLQNDGTVHGKQLCKNYNRAIDVVSYVARKKEIIFVFKKQKYIVFKPDGTDKEHAAEYMDIRMDGAQITREYGCVRILGLWLDRKLEWTAHIERVVNHAHRAYISIYHRYKNSLYIKADWVPKIMETYILSKMSFMVGLWGNASATALLPARNLYNKMVRYAQGGCLSTGLHFAHVLLGWANFDDWRLAKCASVFSNLCRTPISNSLHNEVRDRWKDWNRMRSDDIELRLPYDQAAPLVRYEHGIDSLDPDMVSNGFTDFVGDNDEFAPRDAPDEAVDVRTEKQKAKDKREEKAQAKGCLDAAFHAAQTLRSTDYIFMKDVPFAAIPKRVSFHPQRPTLPSNTIYYEPQKNTDNVLVGFSWDWLKSLKELKGIDYREILVVMSDGSRSSEQHGGCGFFGSLLSFVPELSIEKMREIQFAESNPINVDPPNGVTNYISASVTVARRTSIEFCELLGFEAMLEAIIDLVARIKRKGADLGIKLCSLSVDSLSVLNWIGGVSFEYDINVSEIIERCYALLRQLGENGISVLLSWVRAHDSLDHNELADQRARLAMLNQRWSLTWDRNYETRFGRRDWGFVSARSIRRSCMKEARKRTIAAWKVERDRKATLIREGKRKRETVCSRFLIDWGISKHSAYRKEMRAMTRREWTLLSALRGGHVALNGEIKFRGPTSKGCLQTRCSPTMRESITHFIFWCRQFADERRRFEDVVAAEYDCMDSPQEWLTLSEAERWQMTLFPLQRELSRTRDSEEQAVLMSKRLRIIRALLKYVNDTKRFAEPEIDLSYYEL